MAELRRPTRTARSLRAPAADNAPAAAVARLRGPQQLLAARHVAVARGQQVADGQRDQLAPHQPPTAPSTTSPSSSMPATSTLARRACARAHATQHACDCGVSRVSTDGVSGMHAWRKGRVFNACACLPTVETPLQHLVRVAARSDHHERVRRSEALTARRRTSHACAAKRMLSPASASIAAPSGRPAATSARRVARQLARGRPSYFVE